ncbi:3-oxoacyl-[acyl-carrier-protein] reductase FabG [Streptomonospora litoralis]|uniref:3-oxoacyl-[acyl-carrier-protein] reductase FabG n=1 Tax=Streptomonospora litoralis TaxID=2498135 RepID=A0A4P6Q5Y8_9ACTN|nr:SDR family NAD(P)-dependent oxidoreductase [Streptomonospora litoralis]QBI56168.1 3-oxoacyl-[acyl-carrier-protein] reductase FabG [Streptomonospora litoralis]
MAARDTNGSAPSFRPGTALVTGASSGIGRETARLLAERDFCVFGTSRSDRPDFAGVRMLRLDVTSDDSVAACVDKVLDQVGTIDVLVNNAGTLHRGIAEETALAEAAAVFDTNLFGAARVANTILPHMRERGRGRIVNVGSLAAWIGEPGEGYYAASKAALARYTEALRHEVRHLGVDVSLVEPGAFTTGVVDAATRSSEEIADYDDVRANAFDTLERGLRKGGNPRKAAGVVVKAATARRPKPRYAAGSEALWLPPLRLLLPQWVLERLVRKGFGLPPAKARS